MCDPCKSSPEYRATHSVAVYWMVFTALILLLTVSVAGDQFDLGTGNLVLSLSVSIAKTLLIALFFMHLRHAAPTVRIVAIASLLWLAAAAALVMTDYAARGWVTG